MNRDDIRSVLTVALVTVLVLVLLSVFMMPMVMGGGMMDGWNSGNWGNRGGDMWWGWLLMLLFWVMLISGVVAVIAWAVCQAGAARSSGRGAGSRPDEALEILMQRYARGEITAEQFEQMKRDLAS